MMYADDNYLVFEPGGRYGPFSSHWAACAAMIRVKDPAFRSTGGDRASDLAIEADMRIAEALDQRLPEPGKVEG